MEEGEPAEVLVQSVVVVLSFIIWLPVSSSSISATSFASFNSCLALRSLLSSDSLFVDPSFSQSSFCFSLNFLYIASTSLSSFISFSSSSKGRHLLVASSLCVTEGNKL